MLRKLSYVATACLLGTGLLVVGCGDDDGGGGGPVCGDGICEGDETIATCPEDCTPECGNGIVEQGEECDESDLANTDCADLGYEGGTLGCTDQCTFDTSQCTGGECGNDVVDQGEDCDGTDLGGSTCDSLGFAGGDLACAGDCTFDTAACCDDLCPALGDTQCVGDVVQTCSEAATGCLDWEDTEDCAANNQQCIEDPDGAFCAEPCTDECDTLDELQCNGDVIEICQEGGDGCYDWILDTDCAATSQTCGLVGGTPECVDFPTGGDDCADPLLVPALPYTLDGSDITADFTDSIDFSDATDCGTANGVEAVMLVNLTAGEQLHIWEVGGLDAVIRVMDTCDATFGTCLLDFDFGETDGEYFTAPATGDYYVILEAWSSSPGSVDYELHMEIVPPETDCANTTDDDGDGLIDCEDPDCFGQAGCNTEALCGDGFDNDNDGQTDCDDTDCELLPECQSIVGVWQEFEDGVTPFDMEGCTLSFTFADPNYDYTYNCAGLADFPITPGTGTQAATTLPLSDSDSMEYQLTGGWDFSFFGVAHSSFFVGSNGFVTFGEGDDYSDGNASTFFDYPRIAAYDEDLDPSDATGMVYVDEFADHVVVTFEAVTYYNGTDPNSFQMVMYQNGDIDFHYVYINQHSDVISGLSNGGQLGTAPAQVDFVPALPTAAGDLVITEIMYDPDAVNDDVGEYVEIYNPTSSNFTLEGCTIEDNAGTHTIGTLVVGPGEHAVLARSDDAGVNGGITGAYSFAADIQLGNSGDVITITCGGTAIDTVDFEGGWPCGGAGVSCQLNSFAYNEVDNDSATWWCDSTDTYGSGDTGTPGLMNNNCGMTTLLYEDFSTWPPANWTIVDGGSTTDTWMHCDGCTRSLDGADGAYAMVDSDDAGSVDMVEELITPSVDCSSYTTVLLSFYHYYNYYSGDEGVVEVSTDGGTTWTQVVSYTADTENGVLETFDISADAAGQADVMIRFMYTGNWAWYWLVDDVTVIAL
jgi:hypothetical protein